VRLLVVMALACLAPVAALVVVGSATQHNDNVTAAGRTSPSTLVAEAPKVPGTTAAPATTTTGEGAPHGEPATEATTASTTTSTTPVTEPPTTAAPTTTAAPAPTPTVAAAPTAAEQVVYLVNAQRAAASHPCRPLSVDGSLATAAQGHSDDMAAHDYFSHTSLNGATAQDRAEAAGFNGLVGENIAAGQRSPQDVMAAWMGSAGHRANILNCDYTVIGVGLNTDGWYWTQMFGTPS
jgi:uncharacterized protein YkwD